MGTPNRSLYVRNVPDEASADELRSIFGKYGFVRDIYIPLDYYSRRPRGFAYIEFEEVRDAEDALIRLDRLRYRGREISVEFAQGERKTPRDMRYKYSTTPNRSLSPNRRRSRSPRSSSRSRHVSKRHKSRSPSHSRRSPHRKHSSKSRRSHSKSNSRTRRKSSKKESTKRSESRSSSPGKSKAYGRGRHSKERRHSSRSNGVNVNNGLAE